MTSEISRLAPLVVTAVVACNTPTDDPDPGTKTVMVGDLEVAYLEAGNGPLVLLLHGFPDTPHTWDAIAPQIAAAGFHVVMPFARGYAPTTIPGADPTVDAIGRDVLGLVDALGEDRAILVGHDWGALAAYTAAALAPTRIDKLVTIAIAHPIALVQHQDIPPSPHFAELAAPDAEELVAKNDFQYLDELLHRWSPTWDVPAGTTTAVKSTFRVPGSLASALGYYRTIGSNLPPELFAPLPMPTLTFHGTQDLAVDPRPFADQHTAFSGPFELVPVPVGHFVHLEAESTFSDKLLAFLTR